MAIRRGTVRSGFETIYGTENADELYGYQEGDYTGDVSNDTLYGYGGDDHLYGGYGNDTLIGGPGADTLNGGPGIDTADYSGSSYDTFRGLGVYVSLPIGLAAGGDAEGDVLIDIENLTGSAYHDVLIGDDRPNTLRGNGGNDTLQGNGGMDYLYGDGGNDWLYGGAGTDFLFGGANNDVLDGGSERDYLMGEGGADTLRYWTGGAVDVLDGGTGINTADFSGFGSAVAVDLLYMPYTENAQAWTRGTSVASWDTTSTPIARLMNIENVRGTSGSDTVRGTNGDNVYFFTGNAAGTPDFFDGRRGNDTVNFSEFGSAVIVNLNDPSGIEAWTATASSAYPWLFLWTPIVDLVSVERIVGSDFNDTLIGSSSDNVLNGGLGNDTLTGGAGRDTFVFNTPYGYSTNRDTITDFNPADDTIRLNNDVFTRLPDGALSPDMLHVGDWASYEGSSAIIWYNPVNGALSYHPEGPPRGWAPPQQLHSRSYPPASPRSPPATS